MSAATVELPGWDRDTFSADVSGDRITKTTYRRGVGPGVIVIHELPGITPKVLTFAEEVVAAGFTVVLPSLVGTPGRDTGGAYPLQSMWRICVSHEFVVWASDETSPIVTWLRALAGDLHASTGGPGVGAIGMCFSGGFALAMTVDPTTVAPVLSQPSLPFSFGPGRSAALGLSPADRAAVAARTDCPVLGLHFSADKLVGRRRFPALAELLGDRLVEVELPSHGWLDHSVLTEHRQLEDASDPAVGQVLTFLAERLQT